MVKDGEDFKTRIANDEVEKLRLNFSKCADCDASHLTHGGVKVIPGLRLELKTAQESNEMCLDLIGSMFC